MTYIRLAIAACLIELFKPLLPLVTLRPHSSPVDFRQDSDKPAETVRKIIKYLTERLVLCGRATAIR